MIFNCRCLTVLLSGSSLDDNQVLQAVDRLVHCYEENAKKGERLGKTIDRIGMEPFQAAIRDA